ncbi:MAG: efflux RND transporter periplasmic adaptor subunit [Planctomycetes bacterium]|nr:efflux RND transporter periplasmic adaptor subunit [Planctomycetota bacterium]
MDRILRATLCSLVLSVGLLAAGCRNEPATGASPLERSAPPEVTVARPVLKKVQDEFFYTGRTEAVDSVDIRARVTGFLDSINFVDGDEVEKDKLLFVIDPRPAKADQAAKKAALEEALAQQTLKTADAVRVKALREKGQVSQEEFERSISQKDQADAQVSKTKADLEKADLNVEFCYVTAPMAGRASRKQFSVGNLINADSTTLTNIVAVDQMDVYFDVDEPTALKVQKQLREGKAKDFRQMKVPIYLGLVTDQDYPHVGYLDFVENQLNANTGTVRIRAVFENPKPETGPRLLAPGLFARIKLSLGDEYEALLVPEKSIGTDQGQKFVYVVTEPENRVEYRRVTLGTVYDGQVVVRTGLTKDDKIVVNGLQRVRPKSIVKPVEQAAGTTAEAADGKPQ